jgi:MiaB-like tRNA modifying enzyme
MNIYFETYGCTLNSGEAQKMMSAADSAGHTIVPSENSADMVVLLTCTVIEPTELKILRRLQSIKSSQTKIVVSGCMAAVQKENIKAAAPGAVIIPTPGQVEAFADFLRTIEPEVERSSHVGTEKKYLKDASAPVPIAEGCMGSCTYCITRLARGELRSYHEREILSEIEDAVGEGACEIRLTAQDSALYGADTADGFRFPELLDKISNLKIKQAGGNDFKVRVGMMNPDSVEPHLDQLIEVYLHPRVFKFLHLPVQSGSAEILKTMGRKYTSEQFTSIVERFRIAHPGMTLSTDIIAGFPGESMDDHKASLDLLERIRPDIVNVTRFSARPGTPAESMADKLHGRDIKARSRELTGLSSKISLEKNEALVGKKTEVMATERDIGQYKNTTLTRTAEYKPVVINQALELGQLYRVEIVTATSAYLKAEVK